MNATYRITMTFLKTLYANFVAKSPGGNHIENGGTDHLTNVFIDSAHMAGDAGYRFWYQEVVLCATKFEYRLPDSSNAGIFARRFFRESTIRKMKKAKYLAE